jgi:GNAT superfamily N-acetyltransferase
MATKPVTQPRGTSETLRWVERLRDRSEVLIRPLSPLDHEEERRFISGLSAEARRYRFLAQVADPSEQLVDQLTNVDFEHDVAFAAVVRDDGRERIVGVARYSVDASKCNCECAVTVADAWREKGLGSALMRHLIALARERGMRTMYSIDAVDNIDMRDLANHLGFTTKLDPDDASLYVHRLNLQPEATARS